MEARGRAYAQMGDIDPSYLALAVQDFRAADSLATDPKYAALIGYSQARLANHGPAIALYKQAQAGGFDSPELWNDLGYSYLQTAKLAEAKKALDQAIASNDKLQVAYVNRAKVDLRQALASNGSPKQAVEDLERARALGAHPDICRDQVFVLAAVAKSDESYWAQVVDALIDAHRLGVDTDKLLSDPLVSPLKVRPEIKSFEPKTTSSTSSTKRPPFLRLVDPLGNPTAISPSK